MDTPPPAELPPRRAMLLLVVIGAAGLALAHNQLSAPDRLSISTAAPAFAILGPVVVALGLLGLVDPRIPFSLGRSGVGHEHRRVHQAIGAFVLVAAAALGFFLLFGVYRPWR
ncbi:MAG TPA: hypothetical protein VFF73_09535 [Planctomycetota bacterium]|nr:hypothetical protein [Planctomycetota bacterium]